MDAARDRMLWLIRRMCYDDAVLCGQYRVEYLHLDAGLPHYRLYCVETLVGVARIRHPSRLRVLQMALARYLICIGFDPYTAALRRGFATTPPNAKTTRLPVLPVAVKAAPRLTGSRIALGLT